MDKSEVHLLPAFVLPPRGGEDKKKKKRQRGKGERLMPVTTNIWKKRQRNRANWPGLWGQRSKP